MNGVPSYKAGADAAWVPFRHGIKIIDPEPLFSGSTISALFGGEVRFKTTVGTIDIQSDIGFVLTGFKISAPTGDYQTHYLT